MCLQYCKCIFRQDEILLYIICQCRYIRCQKCFFSICSHACNDRADISYRKYLICDVIKHDRKCKGSFQFVYCSVNCRLRISFIKMIQKCRNYFRIRLRGKLSPQFIFCCQFLIIFYDTVMDQSYMS